MSSAFQSCAPLLLLIVISCGKPAVEFSAFDTLIEEGYEVLLSDTLKIEQQEFVITALKDVAEDSLMFASNTTIQRPLLILKRQASGTFDIDLRNDNIILCASCGGIMGSPFQLIETDENSITISHSGGSRNRWTRNVTFKYEVTTNTWALVSDQGISFDTLNPDGETEEVIYTIIDKDQEVLFEDFNVYQD